MIDDRTITDLEARAKRALDDLQRLRAEVSTRQRALTATEAVEVLDASHRALAREAADVVELCRRLEAVAR